MTAFYDDAAPVIAAFRWEPNGSAELERPGVENDLLKVGQPRGCLAHPSRCPLMQVRSKPRVLRDLRSLAGLRSGQQAHQSCFGIEGGHRWADEQGQLQRVSFPARDHSASDMALPPVHPQPAPLSENRRPNGLTLAGCGRRRRGPRCAGPVQAKQPRRT
jgi:hypothetical protein